MVRDQAREPRHAHAGAVLRFTIEGMICEACAAKLERVLSGLKGITDARVDFATRTAEAHLSNGLPVAEVARIGRTARVAGNAAMGRKASRHTRGTPANKPTDSSTAQG